MRRAGRPPAGWRGREGGTGPRGHYSTRRRHQPGGGVEVGRERNVPRAVGERAVGPGFLAADSGHAPQVCRWQRREEGGGRDVACLVGRGVNTRERGKGVGQGWCGVRPIGNTTDRSVCYGRADLDTHTLVWVSLC